MKTIVSIGLCLFAFGTFAQTPETNEVKPAKAEKAKEEAKAPANPVVFKTMTIERNDIPYDSKEPFIFEFTNTGKDPVLVTAVHTSCGCTTAEKPEGEVAKKKTGKIAVNYDTKRVGPFSKTITVNTNVSAEPFVLVIKGTVLPAPAAPAAEPAMPAQ